MRSTVFYYIMHVYMNLQFIILLLICIHANMSNVSAIFFADTDQQMSTETSIFPDAFDVVLTDLNAQRWLELLGLLLALSTIRP